MQAPRSRLSAVVAGRNPCDVGIVRAALMRLGVERIETVPDGRAAMGALADHVPDIVVVDWRLPAADSVIAAARKGEGGPKVVVTLADPTRPAVDAIKALRVDSIVASPFSPRAFMDRVPRLGPDAG